MGKITEKMRVHARARVDAYICHAANVIRLHGEFRNEPLRLSHSRSAVNLQLKALLGKELTKQMWSAGDRLCLYYWDGDESEVVTQEHVIPLGLLIEHMVINPDVYSFPKSIHSFLIKHLTVAWIPRSLETMLKTFKVDDYITLNCELLYPDSQTDLEQNRIWSRYIDIGHPDVTPPYVKNSRFIKYPHELSWDKTYREHTTFKKSLIFFNDYTVKDPFIKTKSIDLGKV